MDKHIKITVIYSVSTYGRIESIDYYTIQPPASSLTNSTYENSSKKKNNLNITVTPITNKVIILGFNRTDNNILVSGINTIGVKINYITLKYKDNNPLLFTVKDGFFLFTINCYYSNPYNLTLTTGERNQYECSRTTLTVNPRKLLMIKYLITAPKNRIIDYYSINPLII